MNMLNPVLKMRSNLAVCSLAVAVVASTNLLALDWPQWRGPERDEISKETGLLKEWPSGGPKSVWLFENAGNGYSGVAVVNGKLFTMGTRDGNEVLIALDALKGTELWVTPIAGVLANRWGDGPRGTPTVDGDKVYALGGQGTLLCANVADGKSLWKKSMQDLGGKTPGWGYTESVLVEGGLVICTPGGSKGAVAALDKATGDVKWQSTEFTDGAQYASTIPATLNGTRQIIQLTMKSLAGLSAADGKLLWRSDFPGQTAVIPTPVYKDGHVYVTAGYGVGCKMVKIGAGNAPQDVYENKVMKNHHGGVVLVGEHLYGYSDGPGWICQNFKTGEEVWASKSLGKGCVTYAEGRLYCVDENNGTVVLADASPTGWKEHGRFTLNPLSKIRSPSGRVWTHPVVANGKLYLRDQEYVYCFDIKAK